MNNPDSVRVKVDSQTEMWMLTAFCIGYDQGDESPRCQSMDEDEEYAGEGGVYIIKLVSGLSAEKFLHAWKLYRDRRNEEIERGQQAA